MSITSLNYPIRRLSLSLADNINGSASRSCSSPPASPLRSRPPCLPRKSSARLSHKFKAFSSLAVNSESSAGTSFNNFLTEKGNDGCRSHVGRAPVATPRGRSISLFTPRSVGTSSVNHARIHEYKHDHTIDSGRIVKDNPACGFPCNAATPASSPVDGCNIAFSTPASIPITLAPTSAVTVPDFRTLLSASSMSTSSISYGTLDRLLKPERQAAIRSHTSLDLSIDTSVPPTPTPSPTLMSTRTPTTPKNKPIPSPLVMVHVGASYSSPSSPSSPQRFKTHVSHEKQRFPYISPCLSLSSSSVSSESSDSSDSSVPSPTARARRAPPPNSCPPMVLQSTLNAYTLIVHLPRVISPEMVTISAKKGERLDVVADAWHMEHDCHYEWQVRFAPGDVDMSSVRARFNSDGRLSIDVQRHTAESGHIYASRGGWGCMF